jgi:hypothetical protein
MPGTKTVESGKIGTSSKSLMTLTIRAVCELGQSSRLES